MTAMQRLKKLQNEPERFTNENVDRVCNKYSAKAYPKVRLADVFEINGSGISKELYSYGLMAHFDTIVFDSDLLPFFAVEFDGSTHINDPEQIKRDLKKNDLCEIFDLPLLRITSDFLHKQYRGVNLLSWFIEVWFASKWFDKAQEEGTFGYDEPFMPMSFQSIPEMDRDFPLWLSRSARGKVAKYFEKGLIESFSPTCVVWVDQNAYYHCLAWVVINDSNVVYVSNKMRGQQFPAPIHDLLEDVTIVDLSEKLLNTLEGIVIPQTIKSLNQEILKYKSGYRIVSGGGFVDERIQSWHS